MRRDRTGAGDSRGGGAGWEFQAIIRSSIAHREIMAACVRRPTSAARAVGFARRKRERKRKRSIRREELRGRTRAGRDPKEHRDYDDARRGRGPEEREDQSGGGEDRGEQERVHIERVREKDGEDTPERAARVEDRKLRPDV